MLVEIFATYFLTRDECRETKHMYIGNFVYQGVALNTLDTNGLIRSTLGTNGLSVRKC